MNKTEERKFFDIFNCGCAHKCVSFLRIKYDLGFNSRNAISEEGKKIQNDWLEFFTEETKKLEATLDVDFDTLFDEIESNLSGCRDDREVGIYCLSLIAPFAGFLRATQPIKNGTGNTPERAAEIENGFWQLIQMTGENLPYMVEIYKYCDLLLHWYVQRLDWVLMQRGIDLLQIQRDNGIYFTNRNFRMAVNYVQWAGSVEAAKRYIKKLNEKHQFSNTPILDALLGKKAGKYIKYCKTKSTDADIIHLLFHLLDNKKLGYTQKQIHTELLNAGIIETTVQNFGKSFNKFIDPNIVTEFNDFKE